MAEIRIVADAGATVTIDGVRVTREPGQGAWIDRAERTTNGQSIFRPGPLAGRH